MLIKSGGGTGPMKPGNLSERYLRIPDTIRCQFPRDEIQSNNQSSVKPVMHSRTR